jgi:hypothetical protein
MEVLRFEAQHRLCVLDVVYSSCGVGMDARTEATPMISISPQRSQPTEKCSCRARMAGQTPRPVGAWRAPRCGRSANPPVLAWSATRRCNRRTRGGARLQSRLRIAHWESVPCGPGGSAVRFPRAHCPAGRPCSIAPRDCEQSRPRSTNASGRADRLAQIHRTKPISSY